MSTPASPYSAQDAPIGILDSGMGGITIWSAIRRLLPAEQIVYWADQANCPYGGKSRQEIYERVRTGVGLLRQQGVKIIVIACNTATTAAIAQLRQEFPDFSFVGMEPAIKPAARQTRSGVIGVLATRYTLGSEMFRATREKHASNLQVLAVPGDGLVELVEQGKENSPQADTLLRNYIAPMLEAGADQLVLACTHYPLLTRTIRRITGPGITLIDPADAIARHTRDILQEQGLLSDTPPSRPPRHLFISSAGEESSRQLQKRAEAYFANR